MSENLKDYLLGYSKLLDDLMIMSGIHESAYVKDGWLYYDASPMSTPLMGHGAGWSIKRLAKPHWKKVKLHMDPCTKGGE